MLIGIVKNLDNTYEYIFNVDNKLLAMHVTEYGFELSDNDYIRSLFNKLKYNKDNEFIGKFHNYDVFYDKETKIKHFLIGKEEDYGMLFKYNGSNAYLYSGKGFENIVKKFIILGIVVVIAESGLLLHNNALYNYNINEDIKSAYSSELIDEIYSYDKMDYLTAIECIHNSDLPKEIKNILANEDLLKLVFSYYKGTPLEFTSNLKFHNINIKDAQTGKVDGEIDGYYDYLDSCTLHVNEITSHDRNEVIFHEFIHMLQSENSPYGYLLEASADLMTKEFYKLDSSAYELAVDNLKLLINIIGPDPVMELLFGGNDEKFDNILKSNLSVKDYLTIKHHLKISAAEVSYDKEYHDEIRQILYRLYSSIYKRDIYDDPNMIFMQDKNHIYGKDAYVRDDRVVLNTSRMNDKEEIVIITPDYQKLIDLGILTKDKSPSKFDQCEITVSENIVKIKVNNIRSRFSEQYDNINHEIAKKY